MKTKKRKKKPFEHGPIKSQQMAYNCGHCNEENIVLPPVGTKLIRTRK